VKKMTEVVAPPGAKMAIQQNELNKLRALSTARTPSQIPPRVPTPPVNPIPSFGDKLANEPLLLIGAGVLLYLLFIKR
jgi:hypothetical protein